MRRLTNWVILAGCALSTSLAWAQGGFEGPGTYEIRNVKSGLVLDLDRDGVTLVQNPPTGAPTQVWEISPAAQGYFFVTNTATGRALEFVRDANASPVVAQNRTGQNPNQSWQIEPRGAGVWFVSRFRRALDVPSGRNIPGLQLQIYTRSGEGQQQFILRRVTVVTRRDERRDGDRRDDDRRRPDASGRFFDDRDRMWKLAGDGVCFYRERDFRGEAVCTRTGEDLPDLDRAGGGPYRSVKFFGRVREVEVFERPAFRGGRIRLNGDQSDLGRVRAGWTDRLPERIGSYRVE